MELDKLVDAYNYNYAKLNQNTGLDFNLQNCNSMLTSNTSSLDAVFNQKTPYNFPDLIICDDSKRRSMNDNIYLFNMDVIHDKCGNTFNLRNQKNATQLQQGYARNIDVESELYRINYYADKCYYDNYKVNPKSCDLSPNNGLRCNADMIVKDYSVVGQHKDCIGNCKLNNRCSNTPPTDIDCETDVRKRYNFNNNSFQQPSCLIKGDRKTFEKVNTPNPKDIVFQSTPRNQMLMCALKTNETKHDYYHFGDDSGRCKWPAQRLFHNITKRSMLPNFHNLTDISPCYLA